MAETAESDISQSGPPDPPPAPAAAGASAAPAATDTNPDPHGLGPLVGQLSEGAAEAGRAAIAVLTLVLADGESVADLAVGRVGGANGVVALTSQRLLLVSDRSFKADAIEFPLDAGLEVKGWQDEDRATIAIVDEHDSATLDEIVDRQSAQRLALAVEGATG
ncbi:MAG: hypothetical protein ACR2QE_12065 [Acidimicrobiales bacterium]